jgi:hypothetical protein
MTAATDHPATPERPKRRSWGRIALVAALVLSLLGNALTLGALVRYREARDRIMGPAAEAAMLPADLRQEMRGVLKAEAGRLLPLVHDMVRARAAVVAAATAQPYVRAATEAAMLAFRQKVDTLLAATQAAFLDHLDTLAARDP